MAPVSRCWLWPWSPISSGCWTGVVWCSSPADFARTAHVGGLPGGCGLMHGNNSTSSVRVVCGRELIQLSLECRKTECLYEQFKSLSTPDLHSWFWLLYFKGPHVMWYSFSVEKLLAFCLEYLLNASDVPIFQPLFSFSISNRDGQFKFNDVLEILWGLIILQRSLSYVLCSMAKWRYEALISLMPVCHSFFLPNALFNCLISIGFRTY